MTDQNKQGANPQNDPQTQKKRKRETEAALMDAEEAFDIGDYRRARECLQGAQGLVDKKSSLGKRATEAAAALSVDSAGWLLLAIAGAVYLLGWAVAL